jgi:hypothetical protein
MIQTDSSTLTIESAAIDHLKEARSLEPHPIYPSVADVVRYVQEMQNADIALTHAIKSAQDAGLDAEVAMLKRKRASTDVAVTRQVTLAGRRAASNRQGAIDTLNGIFRLGGAPERPLDGDYKGQLTTPALWSPLDSFGRLLARFWLPWKGKQFNSAKQSGDNLLTPSARIPGHIIAPIFSDYRPYKRGLYTALVFKTSVGPSVHDPDVSVLKLDYDLPENPRFLVRSVLDEVVQITGNYYLGKAYLRGKAGYKLAAFFALHKEM